jgi:FkbM family methyltransferase
VLITVKELSKNWGVTPTGVVHVGAHLAEEAHDYEKFRWTPVTWVEAQPELANQLKQKLDPNNHKVFEAAIWIENGIKLQLNIASNSQSSSLLDFGTHSNSYPNIVTVGKVEVITKRLDSLISFSDMPNFINLDIQGVELNAIKSLGNLIENLDYIYVEVNRKQVYVNCTQVSELDEFLLSHGFKRRTTRWYILQGWGDALYVRIGKDSSRGLLQIIQISYRNAVFYLNQARGIVRNFLLRIWRVKQKLI